MEEEASKKSCSSKEAAFHVLYKVPPGDGPYVRAKHAQIVEKDPEAAIVLFWKAISAGDRVDSALKDMAVVMKQHGRAEEAIEAVRSFRDRCSKQAQESLDNLLIDLYKKCGRIDEQIELLKQKLRMIYQGEAFNGKPTKTARSHGRKFQVSIKQETSRILGNLGWAYMQQMNYEAAEMVYRKAQIIEPDANKACNLSLCLIRQGRFEDARGILADVIDRKYVGTDNNKPVHRAAELMQELKSKQGGKDFDFGYREKAEDDLENMIERLDQLMEEWEECAPLSSKRLPIFEEITTLRDQMAC